MQACRVLRTSPATARTGTSINPIRSRIRLPDHGRALATEAANGFQTLQESEPSASRSRVSALLQKTVSLLPQTLSTADNAVGPDSSLFWSNILERSITELSSGSDQVPSKVSIAGKWFFCGFDKWAGSHDLVTALLEDPFTSDATYSDILRNRWKNAPSRVNIEYGKPTAFAGELYSPSDWLQRFPHAIRLTELPELSSLAVISDETESLLLSSDVLLLLCDPVVAPLSDLTLRAKHLLNKPNTILILTSGSTSDNHRQFVSRTLSHMRCQPGQILFVDPRQALGAVTALQANPTSPSTIDRYQRDTLGSRISTVAVAINAILGSKNLSETPLLDLRQETALSQVHGSLSASFRSVKVTKEDVDRLVSKMDDLLSRVQRIRENTRRDMLGKPGEDDKIEKALSQSAKEMNALLGTLSFWRMVWRVDEIGALVSAAVQGQWCKGLENQLILHTGRLDFTQRELSSAAFDLLSASSLHSPVLENQLQQLEHSPTHMLTPSSLTQPIYNRRNQLIQYTTTKLHREAQSAVIGTFGGILSGAGLGWWLAFGEHILSLGSGTEMGTAIGSGALLAVGSIRWAVGKWERAKRRWMQDSARIGEGLTRDLQSTIQRTLDDNVTIVASTACEGMQDLIDGRRNEIHQLHGELCELDAELRACAQFPASRTGPCKESTIE
ncbi:hypothetical protein L210DRAFT_3758591 [Boletus edulis BED1]|uniref:Mmc1 C-terminal domain-containing protein n=1 Tax=Boletus edulis BED1 TaxID=1328754 RepID=A0AAD4C065_BOLED|nr:hypothetical protein L210DRAFT_3758591 [Boletus edulis BED1]